MANIRRFDDEELVDYQDTHRHAGDWYDDAITPDQVNWIDPGSAWGVFVDGEPVSVLRNIPLRQSVRGVVKFMGGIAGVATHPAHRRQGYARELVHAAFEDMREKDQPVSTLYPFKEQFYADVGYVTAAPNLRVRVPLETLTEGRKQVNFRSGSWDLRLAQHEHVRDEIYAFLRESVLPRFNGYAYDPDRNEELWNARSDDTLAVFVLHDGNPQAFARYGIDDGTLAVHEIHWNTRAARSRLLTYLAVYQNQAETLELRNLPSGSDVHAWLRNLPIPVDASLTQAPMVRVIDPVSALDGLPADTKGSLRFVLQDEPCSWNTGVYRLTADDGRLTSCESDGSAPVSMSIEGLTSLAYGLYPLEELVFRDWITVPDDSDREILRDWFAPCSFMNPYTF